MSEYINIEIDICWGKVPRWANFIAMDEDGKWSFFSHKPSVHPDRKRWTLGHKQMPVEDTSKIFKYMNFENSLCMISSRDRQYYRDDLTDEETEIIDSGKEENEESDRRPINCDYLKSHLAQQSILRRIAFVESKLLEILIILAPNQLQAETAADNSVS